MSCKTDFVASEKVHQQDAKKCTGEFMYPRTRTVLGFTLFLAVVIALDTVLFNRDGDGSESIVESLGSFSHADMLTVGCLACFVLGKIVMAQFKPAPKAKKLKEQSQAINKFGEPSPPKNELDAARQSAAACLNKLIDQAARAGDVSKAGELLVEFEEGGGKPDAISYNLVIRTCARAGDVKGAEKWLLRMEQRGIESTVCSYNTLLDAYAKADMAEACESWL